MILWIQSVAKGWCVLSRTWLEQLCDTAFIAIVKDAPVVTMTYSPAAIAVLDTFHIHMKATRKYGKIVNVEWDIGNTGQFTTGAKKDSVVDTAVMAPSIPDSQYICVARVTDDDGNMILDTLKINVIMFKLAANSAGFGGRYEHSSVVFGNKMWLIAGQNKSGQASDVWCSSDGVTWTQTTQDVGFTVDGNRSAGRFGHSSIVFNNKIWVIAGASENSMGINYEGCNDVWNSLEGSSWTQIDLRPDLLLEQVIPALYSIAKCG